MVLKGNLETAEGGEACEGPSMTGQVWAQLAAKDLGAPTPAPRWWVNTSKGRRRRKLGAFVNVCIKEDRKGQSKDEERPGAWGAGP